MLPVCQGIYIQADTHKIPCIKSMCGTFNGICVQAKERCHSTMAQTTMAHASMTIPLWRRSSLAHPGMARSSTAQVRCGAVSVLRIPVWRRSSTAHFTMAQFRVGASKHRRKRAVPHVTCRLQTKYSNYTN